MPTLTYSLNSFTKTNTDMKADTAFTAYASAHLFKRHLFRLLYSAV